MNSDFESSSSRLPTEYVSWLSSVEASDWFSDRKWRGWCLLSESCEW